MKYSKSMLVKRLSFLLIYLFAAVCTVYSTSYKVTYTLYGSVVYEETYSSGSEVNAPNIEDMDLFPPADGYEYTFKKTFPFIIKGNTKIVIEETLIGAGTYSLTLIIGDNAPINLSYESGALININLPASYNREGYELVWDKEVTVMPAEDLTLTAKYVPINSAIAYELDGGVNSPENKEFYNVETCPYVLSNPTKEKYIFKGWYFGDEKVTEVDCGQGDVTLVAHWEVDPNAGLNETKAETDYIVVGNEIHFSDSVKSAELYNMLGVKVGTIANGVIRAPHSGLYILKVNEGTVKVKLSLK